MSKAYPFLGNFKVTSLYGNRAAFQTSGGKSSTDHRGLDLAAIDNTNVVSCTSGVVLDVGFTKARGNYVLVKGYDEFSCIYQHLASTNVKKGDQVVTKQKLGVQGQTGNSSGPHLHLEVGYGETVGQVYNNTVNPADYLGMQNVSTLVGKTFNGNGFITGNDLGTISSNNENQVVTSSTQTQQQTGYGDIVLPSGEYYRVRIETQTVSDWLYGRRYRIFIDIGNGKAFDVSDLRCTFEIIKTSYMEANQSIVQIYNLIPDDENKIIKQGQRIIIEAGYAGSQYGKIFDGQVIQAIRSKENGTDYVLTLVSMDNDRYTSYGLINVAMVAQQSARDAVNVLASKSIVTSEVGSISQMDTVYPRGKVMFGMSRHYLSQLASSENATYYSDDGKINIIKSYEPPPNVIKSYGPQNGLIGTPSQTEYGVSCKVLLDPTLKINGFFHVDNEKVAGLRYTPGSPIRALDNEGIYRVIRMSFIGDTRGDSWYTEVEGITQAGLLPSMIAGNEFYAW